MALYELTDEQAKQLFLIINATVIKAEDAEMVIILKKAISIPVKQGDKHGQNHNT